MVKIPKDNTVVLCNTGNDNKNICIRAISKFFSTELSKRFFTALILILILMGVLYEGEYAFLLLLMFVSVLAAFEWQNITSSSESRLNMLLGSVVIVVPIFSLYILFATQGAMVIVGITMVIAAVDVGAYFVGRKIGGKKLSPNISPNKTVSGLLGGIFSGGIVCGLYSNFIMDAVWLDFLEGFFVGIIMGLLSQAGDLFESYIKRCKGVKDSGNILPGHGGILDRIDGYIFTVPFVLMLIYLCT